MDGAMTGAAAPRFDWLTVDDGTRLRTGFWPSQLEAPRGTVLLLTGRAEFIEKYQETAGELIRRGFQVVGFDWRNQGLSDRPLSNPQIHHVERFERLVDDLDAVVERLVAPLSVAPPVLVAHSMGGLVATMAMARHPDRFAAAILSAPMHDIALGPLPRPLARGLAELACAVGWGTRYAFGQGDYRLETGVFRADNPITSDPRRYALFHDPYRRRPELRVGGVSFGWVRAALRASDAVRKTLPLERVRTPVLLLSAPNDAVVRAGAQREVAARLGNVTPREYPDARHELLMERDGIRDRVWADIDAFLEGLSL